MAAWENEEVFRFIEAYRNEETIWNPKAKDHKSKNAIKHAWIRISDKLDIPITTLKKKKEVLMTTYRQLKRKAISVAATCGADNIYRPSWIFYDALNAFLSDVYTNFTPRKFMGIEDGYGIAEDGSDESPSDSEMSRADYGKPHRQSELQESTKYIKHACNVLRSALSKQREEEDECDIFGKLLAIKLKKMHEDDRQSVMLDITTLLLNAKRDSQVHLTEPDEAQMNATQMNATRSATPPKYFFQLQYSK